MSSTDNTSPANNPASNTASANNNPASNTASAEPSKTTGQYHSLKGTVVEAIGDVANAPSWKQSGREEHAAGEAEYNAEQIKAYGNALTDQIFGAKDRVIGAVTGDREQETQGNVRHDKGQEQQRANKPF